uniref:CARD domain-containing protein n=1 Tax=Plectus sambesii TaxID=2011161 RepID=A0A914W7Q4_9BILA
MDSKEQHALNYCMTLIVDNMNVMSVVDHLRVILTNEEVEIIKAIEISQNQRRELIDILRRKEKQQTPFKRLLRALSSDRVGQGWLANEIQAIYNQEDKVTEFGRVTNVLLSGAEIDDALQK